MVPGDRGFCTVWKYNMGFNESEANMNRERWWMQLQPIQRVIAREQMWACRHTNCTVPCQPPHLDSKNTSPPCKCIGMCEDCAVAAQSWGAP